MNELKRRKNHIRQFCLNGWIREYWIEDDPMKWYFKSRLRLFCHCRDLSIDTDSNDQSICIIEGVCFSLRSVGVYCLECKNHSTILFEFKNDKKTCLQNSEFCSVSILQLLNSLGLWQTDRRTYLRIFSTIEPFLSER